MAEDIIEVDDEPDERSGGPTRASRFLEAIVRVRRTYAALLRLLVINAVFGYAFSSFFLLPKFLRQALSAGPSEIGFVMSLWGIAAVAAAPFVGRGLDRWGRRPFILAGTAGMAIAAFGFLFVDAVGPLAIVLRVAQGVAFTMFFNGVMTSVVDRTPPERVGQAIGIFGISSIFMNALAPFTTEIIAARFGWSLSFLLAGIAAVLAIVLALPVRDLPRSPEVEARQETKRTPAASRRTVLLPAIVVTAAGMAFGVIFAFSQPFALKLGAEKVSGLFLAFTTGAVFVRVFFQRLHDRFGLRRISIASFALYALACLASAALAHVPLELAGLLLGIGHGCFYPAFNALVMERVPSNGRGRGMTSYNAGFNLGLALSNLGLGFVAARFGYPVIFLGSAAAVAVAMGVLVVAVARPRPLPA